MNDAAAGGRAIRRLVVHHTAGPKWDVGTTATACPGRHLYQQLPGIRARVRRHLAEEARLGICLARPIA